MQVMKTQMSSLLIGVTACLFAVLLAACATPLPQATGPVNQVTPVESPVISIEPESGGAGTQVTVTGSLFPAGETIGIHLGPPASEFTQQTYAQSTVSDTGEFTTSFVMPGDWPTGSPITDETLVVVAANEDYTIKATHDFDYQPGAVAADEFRPLPDEQCQDLRAAVEEALGLPASLEEATFLDPQSGAGGAGCQILVTGTGEDFSTFIEVADSLRELMLAQGWTEDPAYLADGPIGTATAYRLDDALALVSAGWEPSPDAGCPENQPIVACKIAPSQQLFTITLNLAERQ